MGPGEEHLVVERVVLECSGGCSGRYSADSSQEQGGEGRPLEHMKCHLGYGGNACGCGTITEVYAQQLFGLYATEKDAAQQKKRAGRGLFY